MRITEGSHEVGHFAGLVGMSHHICQPRLQQVPVEVQEATTTGLQNTIYVLLNILYVLVSLQHRQEAA